MQTSLTVHMLAVVAMIPAALSPLRDPDGSRRPGIVAVALAALATLAVAFGPSLASGFWQSGFATTLWISIGVTLALFTALCLTRVPAWRLTPLLMPYAVALAVMATVWGSAQGPRLAEDAPPVWVLVHIVVAVVTYALLTLAAVASLAAFLQERALKAKRPTHLTRRLPAAREADALGFALLTASEVVLGIGLATGMAVQYYETGVLLELEHKTLLSILAFLVIGLLLVARGRWGVRGSVAARGVLLAYLLLTLGFPGVKFVTEVLLA